MSSVGSWSKRALQCVGGAPPPQAAMAYSLEYIDCVKAKALLSSRWDQWGSGTERLLLTHRPTASNRPASLDRCHPPRIFQGIPAKHIRKSTKPHATKSTSRPYAAALGAGPRFADGIEGVRVLRDGIRGRTLVQIHFGALGDSVRNSVLAMPEYRRRRPNSTVIGIYGAGFNCLKKTCAEVPRRWERRCRASPRRQHRHRRRVERGADHPGKITLAAGDKGAVLPQ
jgi:hypothetical protein